MKLNESKVTKLIMEEFFRDLSSSLELDVAVVGAGPSGMVAAYYLSKAGYKTAIFERRMSIGGGIWGGGMMFNKVVVEEQAKPILEEFGVSSVPKGDDLLVVDAVELASSLCLGALRAGARVYNLVTVEDVAVRDGKVVGVVINWSAAGLAGLHVDPMVILSRRASWTRLLERSWARGRCGPKKARRAWCPTLERCFPTSSSLAWRRTLCSGVRGWAPSSAGCSCLERRAQKGFLRVLEVRPGDSG